MSEEDRYYLLDFDERDHRQDLNNTTPVCIVDENTGGIIAYVMSEDVAQVIIDALRKES